MNIEALKTKFNGAMFDIYRCAKIEANYNATLFLNMISDRGGLETAKYLINTPKESDGFAALFLAGRLDLTVEAMIFENAQWHPLFDEEDMAHVKKRLIQFGYLPDQSAQ